MGIAILWRPATWCGGMGTGQ